MNEDLRKPLDDEALDEVTGGAGGKMRVVIKNKKTGDITGKIINAPKKPWSFILIKWKGGIPLGTSPLFLCELISLK